MYAVTKQHVKVGERFYSPKTKIHVDKVICVRHKIISPKDKKIHCHQHDASNASLQKGFILTPEVAPSMAVGFEEGCTIPRCMLG